MLYIFIALLVAGYTALIVSHIRKTNKITIGRIFAVTLLCLYIIVGLSKGATAYCLSEYDKVTNIPGKAYTIYKDYDGSYFITSKEITFLTNGFYIEKTYIDSEAVEQFIAAKDNLLESIMENR